MNKRKVPMRQCTGCGELKGKKELLRVIRTSEEDIIIDATGKKNGRGAYICRSIECLKHAVKTKGLERSLKLSIPKTVYEELMTQLEKELIQPDE